ncbi:PAS and ANTAR domain-containing protein [Myceligenerans pegani]|uniref:histidine kinase n=1 Tax=Myceligenerans pegani TaxID=2776917 RepID=A0ABR9MUH2_9MICO|nr:PAS and ANTAR domain-containing protein [Myceligenerans sp. TRM 65318]MBE1875030.1 PAS and ANTAR domain-containing protein [Myceligenerans sp. TRM 65318]MBE3017301.1 PAS and ANTAR domain-containing protein [Myceligenerans sp. TRM 65318]
MHELNPTRIAGRPGATGEPAGRFAADLATERWWWSDRTYRIHGFEPAEVIPSTAVVLAHTHPDDRERVQGILERAERTHEPVSTVHRIVDAGGHDRIISIVGVIKPERTGESDELTGYVRDLTSTVEDLAAQRADASVRAVARGRRDIEQAKGVVAMLLDVDDDVAFGVLRNESEVTGVSVQEVSQDLVARAREAGRDYCLSDVLPRLLRS